MHDKHVCWCTDGTQDSHVSELEPLRARKLTHDDGHRNTKNSDGMRCNLLSFNLLMQRSLCSRTPFLCDHHGGATIERREEPCR
jgi:hypothetical protein